jgi:hypothetical protein
MPWEETDNTIRSGHRSPSEFQDGTQKTITLNEKEGVEVVVAKPKGKDALEIESYIFLKAKGWTLRSAKAWFNNLHNPQKEHLCAVLPFAIAEKIMDKPLRIEGLAMTIGISRNFNIYTSEELEAFSAKLVNAPIYLEHVTTEQAVGKVTGTQWDGKNLLYTAEIYDEETAEKIRKGLIQHVSVGADYETLDLVNGKIPHGLFNAEMSLVAVPGIPQSNIKVLEKLDQPEEAPSAAGLAEGLIKKPAEPSIPVSRAIRMIEEILPSSLVQRSWSLGPQRMCQEINRLLFKLRGMQETDSHKLDRK